MFLTVKMLSKLIFHLVSLATLANVSFAYSEILNLITNRSELYCGFKYEVIRATTQYNCFIEDESCDEYVETCLLTKIISGRSVTLLNLDEIYKKHDLVKKQYSTVFPHFIIVISDLRTDIFERAIHQFYNSPHNVFVFITCTTRNITFACKEGVFQKDIFEFIEKFLNILWHKYEMYYIIADFPYVCPGYHITFKGKKPSGLRLYDRKIIIMPTSSPHKLGSIIYKDRYKLTKGYPLRANIFRRFPTSIADCANMHYYWKTEDESITKGMCGMDVLVMHDILRYFKFNVSFPDVDDEEGYGSVNPDTGSATGSLGYLLHDIIDISFNSRFMVMYLDNDEIQFLNHVATDTVGVVMKVPPQVPLWHYAYNFLQFPTMVCLTLTFTAAGIAARMLRILRKNALGIEEPTPYTVLGFIHLSYTGFYFSKKVPVSIIGGICLLISVPMVSIYQGNVNYMYTNSVKRHKVERLAELRERNIMLYTSPTMLEILGEFDESLPFNFESYNKSNLRSHGNIAIVQRKEDMHLEIMLRYMDENGRPMYYFVKEYLSNFYLSYVARKDFPFALDVKKFLNSLLEMGLPAAYYRWTKNSLNLSVPPKKLTNIDVEFRRPTPSALEEHRAAFYFLMMGYIVSTVTFFIERWWAKRSVRHIPFTR